MVQNFGVVLAKTKITRKKWVIGQKWDSPGKAGFSFFSETVTFIGQWC